MIGGHQLAGLALSGAAKRDVNGHLVAVEVGVESRANQRMNFNGVAFNQNRPEGLDAEPVERRRPVQKHVLVANHFLQNRPDLRHFVVNQTAGAADVEGGLAQQKPRDDEGPEKFQRHMLRQTALVQVKRRADDNHRAAGIVHPFAQKILAEAALLALQTVGERFERSALRLIHRAGGGTAPDGIVNQGVHRLLQNPFFVPKNHFRRRQLQQLLQPVIAINHSPVKIVDIARGVTAALKRHHRPEVGRNYRHRSEKHPLRPDAGALH